MALTNYAGLNTPFGIRELGSTYVTQLAHEIQQLQVVDPTAPLLPQEDLPFDQVKVEQVEDDLRLIGVVSPGKPNKLNTQGRGRSFYFSSATFRRGDFIDMKLINSLREPGGSAQQKYGMAQVKDRLTLLVGQANLMLAYLRSQLLSSGAINYTDPETGESVITSSGVPAANIYTIGSGSSLAAGFTNWSNIASATIVDDMQKLMFAMKLQSRAKMTHAIVSGAMLQLISLNAQVRKYLPNNYTTALYQLGLVTWGSEGMVDSICGVKFVEHTMLYDPTADNSQRQYMWPINKITFLALNNPMLPGEILGKTYLTNGEHPFGGTGIYVRTGEVGPDNLQDPTLSPGIPMQVGMAALPVLLKPRWINLFTPCAVSDITAILGNQYVL